MITLFTTLAIAALVFIIALFVKYNIEDYIPILVFFIVTLSISVAELTKRETYKNILAGEPNPYKMEVRYIEHDNTLIPVDTTYIKIN